LRWQADRSDRIEWIIIADQATAAAALQNGEVDWLELPLPDLCADASKNRNVLVDDRSIGQYWHAVFNHLYPPFHDVRRVAPS